MVKNLFLTCRLDKFVANFGQNLFVYVQLVKQNYDFPGRNLLNKSLKNFSASSHTLQYVIFKAMGSDN